MYFIKEKKIVQNFGHNLFRYEYAKFILLSLEIY